MSGITIVFGGGAFGDHGVKTGTDAQPWLEILKSHDVKHIDSAILYAGSERVLGEAGAASSFIIDTKNPGLFAGPGNLTTDKILAGHEKSLEQLRSDKVDIFYIHCHDPKAAIEDWLPGVNQLHQKGLFKRFGLSNFPPDVVRKVHHHCMEKGYVLPTAFQGNYNAVARRQETELFPTLRELGMCFYAYSPIAGGFLTKTKEQIEAGAGRFDPKVGFGAIYHGMYARKSYLEALSDWEDIANEANCSRAELAYRWVRFNSPLSLAKGDAMIIGASSTEQLDQTLVGLENGPLSDKVAARIDEIWDKIKHEAPLDNSDGMRG